MIGEVKEKVEFKNDNIEFLKTLHFSNQKGGCKDCNLRMICLGGCPMSNIWRSGLLLSKSSYTCLIEKNLIPKLLSKIVFNDRMQKVVMEDVEKYEC